MLVTHENYSLACDNPECLAETARHETPRQAELEAMDHGWVREVTGELFCALCWPVELARQAAEEEVPIGYLHSEAADDSGVDLGAC